MDEGGNTGLSLPQPLETDPMGNLVPAVSPDQDFWHHSLTLVQGGGPIMVILLGLSVLGLAIIFLKIYQFIRLHIAARAFIDEAIAHWTAGRPEQALQVLANTVNPIARVLETAIRGLANPDMTEDKVREEATRVAAAELKTLTAYLRGLDVITTLAPLLGLLGTVLGMISAFQQLESAGSQVNPALLAGGIWEALLTTAAGLAVAIPAAAVLHWLESLVERVRHAMEDATTRLFTSVARPPAIALKPVTKVFDRSAHAD